MSAVFETEPPQGAPSDFDFLLGDWRVRHRRLKARWAALAQWEVFEGAGHCEPRLSGLANVDELTFPSLGYAGLAVRTFDLAARRWSIWWADGRTGRLGPRVSGGFLGDRGEFWGEDEDGGAPVLVRFLWLRGAAHGGPRWEQAFSRDGVRWETNWFMQFTR